MPQYLRYTCATSPPPCAIQNSFIYRSTTAVCICFSSSFLLQMGRATKDRRPGSSSSSSEFEFTVSLSPSSKCPADELFYKGQLLPLHLSPRISMVRTLLLASSSTSSSSTDTTTTASRDSNGSSSSASSAPELLLLHHADLCSDSSRPSSVTDDDHPLPSSAAAVANKRSTKYFQSFANRINSSAKQVIRKYVKKVKPLYEKLSKNQSQSQSQGQSHAKKTFSFSIRKQRDGRKAEEEEDVVHASSFSGNLRFPRRKRCAGSCPSSMRSSPTHSGLLSVAGFKKNDGSGSHLVSSSSSSSSSMEELQNAIQGAIAHCKSSMVQSNHNKSLLV